MTKYVVNTVSSLLSAANVEQLEKILIPGIRGGCAITMQIIPFDWKCPCKEKHNLKLFKGHWNIPTFSEGECTENNLN